MADPRRRRGRSGRGGRIPKKGESQTASFGSDEQFVSFPLDTPEPIQITSPLDPAQVEALFTRLIERERAHAAAVRALAEQSGDPALADVQAQVDRHRQTLEQLARDLGSRSSGNGGNKTEGGEAVGAWELVSRQRASHLGWTALQRVAYASGDKRIDRAVKPVVREKERHTEVLEEYALRQVTGGLVRDLD
ncbi:MAG: hypothetical protein ACK47B_25995 [Armatimonadota bacterium]